MTRKEYRGSPTRRAFLAAKQARREQRAHDKYVSEHSFFCKGTRRRRGEDHHPCLHEVRFREKREGQMASCRMCGQSHIYAQGKITMEWMTIEAYEAGVAAGTIGKGEDDHAWEGTEQKPMRRSPPKEAAGEHLPSCRNKDVSLFGLKPTVCIDNRVMWYLPGVGLKHVCYPKGRLEAVLAMGHAARRGD